jgi:hypothetical protein
MEGRPARTFKPSRSNIDKVLDVVAKIESDPEGALCLLIACQIILYRHVDREPNVEKFAESVRNIIVQAWEPVAGRA